MSAVIENGHEIMVELIAATTNMKVQMVLAELGWNSYPNDIKISPTSSSWRLAYETKAFTLIGTMTSARRLKRQSGKLQDRPLNVVQYWS